MTELIIGNGSSVVVTAKSTIHDVQTTWPRIRGRVRVDLAHPEVAEALVTVDMRVFEAGDKLRSWKLRSEIDPDRYPEATFTLARVEDVKSSAGGVFEATAVGVLRWRGRELPLAVPGRAVLVDDSLEATGQFELDMRQLGIRPPSFLMFKLEPEVRVAVRLAAGRSLS